MELGSECDRLGCAAAERFQRLEENKRRPHSIAISNGWRLPELHGPDEVSVFLHETVLVGILMHGELGSVEEGNGLQSVAKMCCFAAVEHLEREFRHEGCRSGIALHETGDAAVGELERGNDIIDDVNHRMVEVSSFCVHSHGLGGIKIIEKVNAVPSLREHIPSSLHGIVRPEIIGPAGIHHLCDRDQRAGDELPCPRNRRVVPEFETNHEYDTALFHGISHSFTLFERKGKWFLHHDMLARLSGSNGQTTVRIMMGADVHCIDGVIEEQLLRVARCD